MSCSKRIKVYIMTSEYFYFISLPCNHCISYVSFLGQLSTFKIIWIYVCIHICSYIYIYIFLHWFYATCANVHFAEFLTLYQYIFCSHPFKPLNSIPLYITVAYTLKTIVEIHLIFNSLDPINVKHF